MSVRLMSAVFELTIPPMDKLVLLAMADHARDDGSSCYPSVKSLAKKTSQSRRGVQKIIRRLEGAGLVVLVGSRRGGKGCTAEYRIMVSNGAHHSPFAAETANPVRCSAVERANQKDQTANHRTQRANQSAPKGERGSPESSGTIIQPSDNRKSAPAAPSPSVFTGQHLSVTQKQDALLGEAFPWVDRPAEYRKVDSWLEANPDKRPKKLSRFLHGWFSRISQPKGKSNGTEKQSATALAIQNAKALGLN